MRIILALMHVVCVASVVSLHQWLHFALVVIFENSDWSSSLDKRIQHVLFKNHRVQNGSLNFRLSPLSRLRVFFAITNSKIFEKELPKRDHARFQFFLRVKN